MGGKGGAASVSAEYHREFRFTDADFRRIAQLISARTGIMLPEGKRDMVYSRLVRRLRLLNLDSFESYCGYLEEDVGDELVQCTNAITTNLTAFFRENHHFEYLRERLLPHLRERKAAQRRLRIWSAGCSTGEEPYSIVISLREALPGCTGWDIKVLATDLDSNVVATAEQGVYGEERVANLSKERLQRWFSRGTGQNNGMVRVQAELRSLITFRQLNLLEPWPMRGPFDIIFCRNVVIYFSKDTQRTLFNRYADLLADDGHLFVGHSESLHTITDRFKLIGNTIYRKVR